MSQDRELSAREQAASDVAARAKTMAESLLPPIAAETMAAMLAAIREEDDDSFMDAFTIGLKQAFYAGVRYGGHDAAAQFIEQGYDGTKVTRIDLDDIVM